MFKLCVFVALIAYASAGLISTGLLDDGISLGGLGGLSGLGTLGTLGGLGGYGGIALAGPKVIAAPTIAVKAGATSYQNSNLLALHPTPVVTKAIAAPIVTKVASPISILGLGNLGLGGLGLGIH